MSTTLDALTKHDGRQVKAMYGRLVAALRLEHAELMGTLAGDVNLRMGSFEWRQLHRDAARELAVRHPELVRRITARLGPVRTPKR